MTREQANSLKGLKTMTETKKILISFAAGLISCVVVLGFLVWFLVSAPDWVQEAFVISYGVIAIVLMFSWLFYSEFFEEKKENEC